MIKNFIWVWVFFALLVLSACGSPKESKSIEGEYPQENVSEVPTDIEKNEGGDEGYEKSNDSTLGISDGRAEDYLVQIEAPDTIKIGQTGELSVWIGFEDFQPAVGSGSFSTETLPAEAGNYAKIIPKAPGFELDRDEYKCMKIFPKGSSVVFNLKPKEQGTYPISVIVEVYSENGCLGTPIPRASRGLNIVVVVDKERESQERKDSLWSIFCDKFNVFFGSLLVVIFGFIIYMINKFLKKKTGYNGGGPDN